MQIDLRKFSSFKNFRFSFFVFFFPLLILVSNYRRLSFRQQRKKRLSSVKMFSVRCGLCRMLGRGNEIKMAFFFFFLVSFSIGRTNFLFSKWGTKFVRVQAFKTERKQMLVDFFLFASCVLYFVIKIMHLELCFYSCVPPKDSKTNKNWSTKRLNNTHATEITHRSSICSKRAAEKLKCEWSTDAKNTLIEEWFFCFRKLTSFSRRIFCQQTLNWSVSK